MAYYELDIFLRVPDGDDKSNLNNGANQVERLCGDVEEESLDANTLAQ